MQDITTVVIRRAAITYDAADDRMTPPLRTSVVVPPGRYGFDTHYMEYPTLYIPTLD
jgi:hypothetical protein